MLRFYPRCLRFCPYLTIISIIGFIISGNTIIRFRKLNNDINNKTIKKIVCSPLKIKILFNYTQNNKFVNVIGVRLYCRIDKKIKILESYFQNASIKIYKVMIKKYEEDIQKELQNFCISYYGDSLYITNTNTLFNITKNLAKKYSK